jgi:two-component system response regulator GlrR
VGSNTEEIADVRLVAATNRDLRQEVAERRFREDLFYRLHVVPIAVAPLRERKEDVPLLAELFLERAAARHGMPAPRMAGRARAALVDHAWPGNVRELANVMEAAVLLCRDGEVNIEHLPGIDIPSLAAAAPTDLSRGVAKLFAPYTNVSATLPSFREARDTFERAYLEALLARSAGNVAVAAKLAGRNRTDLYDLLRRHGLSPGEFKG